MILMILNIFSDYIFRYLIAHCANKISIFPKFTTPQLFLDFRIIPENLSCRFPLQPLHHFSYRISRRKSQKKVNMVLSYLHYFYLKFITKPYLFKTRLYKFSYITSQYPFSIFGSPYKMISRIIYGMTRSFDRHATSLSNLEILLKDNVSSPP